MTFEFATSGRIHFGAGSAGEIGALASRYGSRVIVVAQSETRAQPAVQQLQAAGLTVELFLFSGEPTVQDAEAVTAKLQEFDAQCVVGWGGGSALDLAKAGAALATNEGGPLDYVEVIGKGKVLSQRSLPVIAVPLTAGTGSEVTANAVLASREAGVKVSLRSPLMLPTHAVVDPELMLDLPANVTASTGMDALTQLIEPFVSTRANFLTDALCGQGIGLAADSIRTAVHHPTDLNARSNMSAAALLGGMALANAKLGAVHGFAAAIGGRFGAPHGAICAVLLAPVMQANVRALDDRQPNHPALGRYRQIAAWLIQDVSADVDDGIEWVAALAHDLGIPRLTHYGVTMADFDSIATSAAASSSMQGNPIQLDHSELVAILESAL